MEIILVISLLFFFSINVPIAFSIGLASLFTLLYAGDIPITLLAQRMFVGCDSFPLLALPFFMLAGALMEHGGISAQLIKFADNVVGHIRGGIGMVSVLAAMLFASMCGAAAAATAAIGAILIPAMLKNEYDRPVATAVQATAGSIGVIIPPSIPMIIFGVVGSISIGDLFLGGIIPGIIVGFSLMLVMYLIAKKNNYPVKPKSDLKTILISFKNSLLAFLMPVIILGGIFGGIVTPTEAAILAVAYGFLLGFFVYRKLKLKDLPAIFLDTAIKTSLSMLLIATSLSFAWIIASQQIPQKVVSLLLSISQNPQILLTLISIFLLAIGTFLDPTPALIILVPILLPAVVQVGVNPIHFGVLMVFVLAIGLATPPVGVTLFIACSISGESIRGVSKTVLPFVGIMFLIALLMVFFPKLVLLLPELFAR